MDIIGLEGYGELSDHQREVLDISGTIDQLDDFIMRTIEAREWSATLENYKDVVDEMMSQASLDERMLPDMKLEKLFETMEYLKSLSKFKKMKKEVEELGELSV